MRALLSLRDLIGPPSVHAYTERERVCVCTGCRVVRDARLLNGMFAIAREYMPAVVIIIIMELLHCWSLYKRSFTLVAVVALKDQHI